MDSYKAIPKDKDPVLWGLARRRASFKTHLGTYLVMSVFFWLVWFLSGNNYNEGSLPWPLWPMLGWGIGLAFHYFAAYVNTGFNRVEKEYQKLKQQHQQ